MRLDYLVIRCADLARSLSFYEALGLRFVAERHGAGPAHHSCELGGLVLELYPATDSVTSGLRLGLQVRGVAAAVERAGGAGGGRLGPAGSVVLRDPDGNEIALTEG